MGHLKGSVSSTVGSGWPRQPQQRAMQGAVSFGQLTSTSLSCRSNAKVDQLAAGGGPRCSISRTFELAFTLFLQGRPVGNL